MIALSFQLTQQCLPLYVLHFIAGIPADSGPQCIDGFTRHVVTTSGHVFQLSSNRFLLRIYVFSNNLPDYSISWLFYILISPLFQTEFHSISPSLGADTVLMIFPPTVLYETFPLKDTVCPSHYTPDRWLVACQGHLLSCVCACVCVCGVGLLISNLHITSLILESINFIKLPAPTSSSSL